MEECSDPDCRRSLRALADTFALNCIMKDVIFRCAHVFVLNKSTMINFIFRWTRVLLV